MRFSDATAAYYKFLSQSGYEINDKLRIETQIESLKDWSQVAPFDAVQEWVQNQKKARTIKITDIRLTDCRKWEFDQESGIIKHETGDFFTVQGIRVTKSSDREVGAAGWDQPIIKEVGFDGGILGILRQKINSVPHYLIEAKAEPGNPELIQLSPSLQATFSNINQSHGGRKPDFLDYFLKPKVFNCSILFDQWMSEDGGRLYNKRNRCMLVQVPEKLNIKLNNRFMWLSLFQIKCLIKQNSVVNPHVRGIISHL